MWRQLVSLSCHIVLCIVVMQKSTSEEPANQLLCDKGKLQIPLIYEQFVDQLGFCCSSFTSPS